MVFAENKNGQLRLGQAAERTAEDFAGKFVFL